MRSLVERYNGLSPAQKKRGLIALLLVLGLLGIWLSDQEDSESMAPLVTQDPLPKVTAGIYVHIVGEVLVPGLYQLPVGARTSEAVERAGGFSPDAAQESINLARILTDGEQITVLSQLEMSSGLTGGKVSLNRGTKEGMGGNLGEMSWQLLAPSPTASEASDSNDASLVVLFESREYSVLFLGDLGLMGQERLLKRHPRLFQVLKDKSLVTKVAHHGSADQSAEFYRAIDSEILVYSVGKNDYGHPAGSALRLAWASGAKALRTDKLGHIAIGFKDELQVRYGGKLTA